MSSPGPDRDALPGSRWVIVVVGRLPAGARRGAGPVRSRKQVLRVVDNSAARGHRDAELSDPGPSFAAMTEWVGALAVHRAERADALTAALAELLATPLPDPFTAEVVAVPARGVERWLAQRLSHRLGAGTPGDPTGDDGVCAGVEFPSPSALLHAVVAAAIGSDPDVDPWHPARLVWPLLEVIDEHASEPWCAPLGAHLGVGNPSVGDTGGFRRGRRYGTARRLAELFASYAAHRPQLLRSWAAGAGLAGDVAGDLDWQPQLWRRLRERIGGPDPAQRWSDACAALRTDPGRVPLPARLSLFGPTRLPAAQLAVLVALARHREVHLWLPHPSPALWDRLAATVPAGADPGTPGCRGGRRTRRRARRGTRCCPRSGATCASCRSGWPRRLRTPPTTTISCPIRRRPCSGGCSEACATTCRRVPDHRTGAGRGGRRPQRPGARLPRSAPPGRGAARADRRAARRRRHAGAARHPRDVPGRRDVRAADLRGVRARRARRPGCRRHPPRASAAGAAGRPGVAPAQPAAGHRGHAAGAGRLPGDRRAGARPAGD